MTAVEDYRTRIEMLSARTVQQVRTAEAGLEDVPPDEWSALVAVYLAASIGSATMLADEFVSQLLDSRPIGIVPNDPVERLTRVLRTVISEPEPLPRLERIALSEPERAARNTTRIAMQRNGVLRYTWHLDSDPCPECIELGSKSYPISTPAISHPRCTCTPIPIRS